MKKILLLCMILTFPLAMFGQQMVSGVVTGVDGVTLPGVNVTVKGTFTGTATDRDGRYVIASIEGDILIFSFMGYKTLEVANTGVPQINVVLEQDVIGMDEVIVIGYGTTTRKEVTGSVTTIRADEMLQGNVRTPLGGIQGTVAGLSIMRANGADPNAEHTIRLRGLNSFSGGKSPLIIVDGVVWDHRLDMINPDMIESVDILKDGSAAAIYGTRATNGVILITLKQPHAGEARYELSYSTTLESVMEDKRWFTPEGYRQLINDFAPTRVSYFDRGASTNWQQEVFRNPVNHNLSFNVSGGMDRFRYLANIYMNDDQGLVEKNFSRVITPSLFLSTKGLNDRLTIDYSFMYSNARRSYPPGGILTSAIRHNPTEPVYDPSNVEGGGYYFSQDVGASNPIAQIGERENESNHNFFKGSVNSSLTLFDGFRANFVAGYNFFQNRTGTYLTSYYPNLGKSGEATDYVYDNYNLTFDPNITYSTSLGDHNFQALAGYSYFENMVSTFTATNSDFDSDLFLWNNIGAGLSLRSGTATMGSNKQSNKLIAFYGRLIYNYQYKYLLSTSLRYEGSSRFGHENKWGWFPAVSVGWRVNEEDFMSGIGWINELKIRGGVGVTGNQEISNYQSLTRMTTGARFFYNGEWITSFQSASNPNPYLKWEMKTEYNLGIDFGLFQRFSGSIDYYSRTTSDLLWNYAVPVPPYITSSMYANVGAIRNRGVELQLNTAVINRSAFRWNSSFNFFLNRNMVMKLSDPSRGYELPYLRLTPAGTTWTQKIEEGQPVGNFWAPIYIGAKPDGTADYKDVDGNGVINTELDREIIGHDYPLFELGWQNSMSFGKFDLSFSLRSMIGQSLINYDRITYEVWGAFNSGQNVLRSILDRPDYTAVAHRWDSRFLEKASFLKLDNLVLGYNIERYNLRVFFSGNNLVTITSYSGNDPEIPIPNFNTHITSLGAGSLTYPYSRSFSIGFKLNL